MTNRRASCWLAFTYTATTSTEIELNDHNTTQYAPQSPGFSCSDFGPISYRVHSSAWPIRVGDLADVVESARSVGAHYEDLSDGGEP